VPEALTWGRDMARNHRGSLFTRLADLERRTDRAGGGDRPRATVYLPRKDGDTRPPGTVSDAGGVRIVLYVAQRAHAI
jgi:hypothetical protein